MPNQSPGIRTSTDHYENFPVASFLCPSALRPAVGAIYHFARTADDIADEGTASAEERLVNLALYRTDLEKAILGRQGSGRWPDLFRVLAKVVDVHQLPVALLHDLINAFEQDVRNTATGHVYADIAELLTYCKLSANPVGRLLLHLYGVNDAISLQQSDHICSALQLINFWQDISVDMPRQRHYLPAAALQNHGLQMADFLAAAQIDQRADARRVKLVAELCSNAKGHMLDGAPLSLRIPGRAGWELRLVVQGGLRILEKMAEVKHRSWEHRPTISKFDAPLMLWRAFWMT